MKDAPAALEELAAHVKEVSAGLKDWLARIKETPAFWRRIAFTKVVGAVLEVSPALYLGLPVGMWRKRPR